MEKYYLAEASYITALGKLAGKTLRCFEVMVSKSAYGKLLCTPTGVTYSLIDGKLVKGTTNSSLAHKWTHQDIRNVTTPFYYNCMVFTTPELAILSKLASIKDSYHKVADVQKKAAENLLVSAAYIPTCDSFLSLYPEYSI